MKPTTIALAGLAVLALITNAPSARADEACRQLFPDQSLHRQACEACPAPPGLPEEEALKHRLHPFCVIRTARGWDIIPGGRISPNEVLISVGPAPEVPLGWDAADAGAIVQGTVGDQPSAALPTPVAEAPSGSCGYYTNSTGDRVPRPCGNWHTQPPPQDWSAECRDGTYSFSRHRNGTCSGHGGVVVFRSDAQSPAPTGAVGVAPPVPPLPAPACAENGSCYGDISNITGAPKTIHVDGYYRSDGTYVRGYYRSHR